MKEIVLEGKKNGMKVLLLTLLGLCLAIALIVLGTVTEIVPLMVLGIVETTAIFALVFALLAM